ncbi:MAG: acetyltransferase [Methylococcales bacterium]
MTKPLIIIGGGGHAKVLLDVIKRCNFQVLGLVDPNYVSASEHLGLSVLGDDQAIQNYSYNDIVLVNGLGSLPKDLGLRHRLFTHFQVLGYTFKTLIDPTAFLAADHQLGNGVQVLAGVIIQAGTIIAENSIINSGAIVEHDCRIGKHVHIAPGAVLSGAVEVGDYVHIGTGAVVIQGLRIGTGSIIGAGSVVTKDVADGQIVYPARSCIQAIET